MARIEDDPSITVFDLPQLCNKPSASSILSVLHHLIVVPSSFSGELPSASLNINEDGVAAYLTRFVASPLTWISSDTEKEEIWEVASQRLTERSGRMAMASMSRTFSIGDFAVNQDGRAPRYIHIDLNEPSMTDDNVGHKTWSGSFLLAKRLAPTMTKHFPCLVGSLSTCPKSSHTTAIEHLGIPNQETSHCSASGLGAARPPAPPPPTPTGNLPTVRGATTPPSPLLSVLELGAGTGLTGIAAAALFSNATVHVTDLPSIVPNLSANIQSNSHLFSNPPTATVLDWSTIPAKIDPKEQYDCILAADSLYDPRHPDWLTNAFVAFLKRQQSARVIVELPFRDMDLSYHDLLRQEMARKGFFILEEGEESGWDDWEGSWSEKLVVRFWWSVWAWADEESKTSNRGEALEGQQRQAAKDRQQDLEQN